MKLNMLRFSGSFLSKYKAMNGEEKTCVVIPIDANNIILNEEKRKAMVELVAIVKKNLGDDSHYIQHKVSVEKIYKGERPNIIGHMSEMYNPSDNDYETDQVFKPKN